MAKVTIISDNSIPAPKLAQQIASQAQQSITDMGADLGEEISTSENPLETTTKVVNVQYTDPLKEGYINPSLDMDAYSQDQLIEMSKPVETYEDPDFESIALRAGAIVKDSEETTPAEKPNSTQTTDTKPVAEEIDFDKLDLDKVESDKLLDVSKKALLKIKDQSAKLKTAETLADMIALYEENPQEFALKYFPEAITNLDGAVKPIQIDETTNVRIPLEQFEKLKTAKYVDENGKLLINLNNTHAFVPGTDTYNFNKVLQEGVQIIENAKSKQIDFKTRKEQILAERKQRSEAILAETKEYVINTLGENEEFYNTKVLPHVTKQFSSLKTKDFVNAIPEVITARIEKRAQELLKNNKISASNRQEAVTEPQSGVPYKTKNNNNAPDIFKQLGVAF